MVVAAFALPMEVRPVLRPGDFRAERVAGYKVYRGGIGGTDAVLFVSGVGAKRAYEAAREMISTLKPTLYISAGLCGSISPDASIGDVLVADEILSYKEGSVVHSYGAEDGLLASTGAAAELSHTRLICSDRVIVTASEKRSMHENNPGAAIVDMESAGAARAASEAGIPFMAIKAVSDGHAEDLPVDFNIFTRPDGELNLPGLILHVLTHPSTIGPLMSLSRNSKTAADNLAASLANAAPHIAAMLP